MYKPPSPRSGYGVVADQCRGVADCAVFGVPDDDFDESRLAASQPADVAALDVDQVHSFLRMRMAGYKVQRRVTPH